MNISRHILKLLLCLTLLMAGTAAHADNTDALTDIPEETDVALGTKPYRLVNTAFGCGSVSIGNLHGQASACYHVADDADMAEDSWWYIDKNKAGQWRVRNAKTNECLRYNTTVTLTPLHESNERDWWMVDTMANGNTIRFYYMNSSGTEAQYMKADPAKPELRCSKYNSNTYFYLIDNECHRYPDDKTADPDSGHGTPPEEPQEEDIVTTQGLPVLKIQFDGKSLTDEYQDGNMKLHYTDNTKVELNARFKRRGATAKKYTMKPSFNMKLRDENGEELDTTLCGLRQMSSWILDAMAIDRICMRNRVAFDIWNAYSTLPYSTDYDARNGTVGQFVEVYINNVYKGIYCMTDRVNRKLLNLKKPDVADSTSVVIRGVMYKHGTNNIGDQSSRRFSEDSLAYVIAYHDAWELSEPEEYAGAAAWAPLDSIYNNKNNYAWVKDHFYLQQLAEYQILITALSIGDNWGNKNSIISARNVTTDGNKRRFVYTPWDLDTSLGGSYDGKYYDGNYSKWTINQIASASSMPVPFPAVNRQSEYRQMLAEVWHRVRLGALSVESVQERLHTYRDLFLGTGAWQRYTEYWSAQTNKPCYVDDLAKETDLIVEWYRTRFSEMDAYFGTGEENGIEAPCIKSPHDEPIYDLRGIPVVNPGRGIYIQGGRKIVNTGR